jgi:hypothetical protein
MGAQLGIPTTKNARKTYFYTKKDLIWRQKIQQFPWSRPDEPEKKSFSFNRNYVKQSVDEGV